MDYTYNDFELVHMVTERSEEAESILYYKYYPVIEIKVNKYMHIAKSIGMDKSDLMQEGMIGLSQALVDFKENENVKFSTFANLCIEREILSALTSANRKKHQILNQSLSLDYSQVDDENSLINFIYDKRNVSPEEHMITAEKKREILDIAERELTDFEKKVFDLKISGFEYREISEILNKKPKSIDNALQRIKKKIIMVKEI